MPRCEDECCKIPVCLEFTGATATDEFKEQMTEIFTEVFANLCSFDGEERPPRPRPRNTDD